MRRFSRIERHFLCLMHGLPDMTSGFTVMRVKMSMANPRTFRLL